MTNANGLKFGGRVVFHGLNQLAAGCSSCENDFIWTAAPQLRSNLDRCCLKELARPMCVTLFS